MTIGTNEHSRLEVLFARGAHEVVNDGLLGQILDKLAPVLFDYFDPQIPELEFGEQFCKKNQTNQVKLLP